MVEGCFYMEAMMAGSVRWWSVATNVYQLPCRKVLRRMLAAESRAAAAT